MNKNKDKVKCPKCGSNQIYQEISIVAKRMVNTNKIFDINKNYIDNEFSPYYCKKCGWSELA